MPVIKETNHLNIKAVIQKLVLEDTKVKRKVPLGRDRMALEYCIYCGHPVKGVDECGNCKEKVQEIIPLENVVFESIPGYIISQFEKAKVSFFAKSTRARYVNNMKNRKAGYKKVTIYQMYAAPYMDSYTSNVMYVSVRDMDGSPIAKDIAIEKRGVEHMKLQKTYSASLKKTEAYLVKFDDSTYYVFSAADEAKLGESFAASLADIDNHSNKDTKRKIHDPRKDLDTDHVIENVKLSDLYSSDDYDPLRDFAVRKALDVAERVIDAALAKEDQD